MALTKPYILVGGIVLFVALLFFFTKLPEIKLEEEEEAVSYTHLDVYKRQEVCSNVSDWPVRSRMIPRCS